MVPAYNEEGSLADTVESLVNQTHRFDRIVVVDDGSTDATGEIAWSYPQVTCLRPERNLGSKAAAQSYGLDACSEDVVITIDADTRLSPDYVEKVAEAFDADPNLLVAAGCVLPQKQGHWWNWWLRGRWIEYLYGFHFFRAIENAVKAPMVCSGCCSAFRRKQLVEAGGFPPDTIVEDMAYTIDAQCKGGRARYLGQAVAYAADPEDLHFMKIQVTRWMHGYWQNVRRRGFKMLRRKPALGGFYGYSVISIMLSPLWYATPLLIWLFDWGAVPFVDLPLWAAAPAWFALETAFTIPVLVYAARRRGIGIGFVFTSLPSMWVIKTLNFTLAWKAMICEMGPIKSWRLSHYAKGH